jgi:hypothetical protein
MALPPRPTSTLLNRMSRTKIKASTNAYTGEYFPEKYRVPKIRHRML